jgi:hypothetical protein
MQTGTRPARPAETAEAVYVSQHATILAAIESLQATLDNMRAPGDPDAPITWVDVSTNAHIVDALRRAELV